MRWQRLVGMLLCMLLLTGCARSKAAQRAEWVPSFAECPECYEGCNRYGGSSVVCEDEYGDKHKVESQMY